jgi:hypothetical protein
MLVSIGNFQLCDGTREGGVGVTNLRFSVARAIQTASFFRGSEISTYDRGNRSTSVSCEIVRTFASQQKADVYILEHEDTVPSTGVVTFTAFKSNGQKVVRYLASGKIQSHQLVEQIGVTTRHQYAIVGGGITQAQPSS